jgi:hypothetical protein
VTALRAEAFAPDVGHAARHRSLCDRVIELQRTGYGLPRLAVEIGHHQARLEAWLKNPDALPAFSNVIGDDAIRDQMAQALAVRLAEIDTERDTFSEPASVETTVTRAVMDGIDTARDLRRVVLIDAPPGLGKSDGVGQYLAQRRRVEGYGAPVWVLSLNEYNVAPSKVLDLIGAQCGAGLAGGKVSPEQIEAATAQRRGVLVLDEANHLGDAQRIQGLAILNGLRSFVDRGLFGLAILGNGEVYRRLAGGRHAQLFSRMAPGRVDIEALGKGGPGQPALQAEDVEAVMVAWGVSGVKERALCLRLAGEPGALRNLADTFKLCRYRYGGIDALSLKAVAG